MPDSPDDFDQSNVGEFTATLDSAELAARLYSPVMYARSGQVIYSTDFSKGFSGYEAETSDVTDTIDLQTAYAMGNGLALKLSTLSTDETDCYIALTIPYVEARYYTIDLGLFLIGETASVRIEFYIMREGVQHRGELWYSYTPFKVELLNDDHDLIDITSLESSDSYFGNLAHIRLIIDTNTGLYKQLLINSVPFNVSHIGYYRIDGSYTNKIEKYISLKTNSVNTAIAYVQWSVVSISNTFP